MINITAIYELIYILLLILFCFFLCELQIFFHFFSASLGFHFNWFLRLEIHFDCGFLHLYFRFCSIRIEMSSIRINKQ